MTAVTEWKFLLSSHIAWEEMLDATRRAEKSIDLIQFVLGHDGEIIEKFSKLLIEKRKQGVSVRLLLDVVGSMSFYKSAVAAELEAAGVEIVFHRTIAPRSFKRIVPTILRDHRKLIVFDDTEVHIGGVIIQERAREWRDTNVAIKGPLVEECISLFDTSWEQAKNMHPLGKVLTNDGKGEFFLAGNSYRRRDKTFYTSLVKAIALAKKTIYITTPYFALTHDLRRALFYAAENGVEVIMLLPRRSDNALSDFIGRFFYAELLRHNIQIYHYTKSILHAKTMTIDGSWSTVGSCNLDWLSILLNYELNLVTHNADFASGLESIYRDDISSSTRVTLETGKWFNFFD